MNNYFFFAFDLKSKVIHLISTYFFSNIVILNLYVNSNWIIVYNNKSFIYSNSNEEKNGVDINMNIRNMMYVSLFAAVVAVLGLIPPIPLPFTPVPITAQTFGVMLAGAVLGAKRGGLSLLVFDLLVAVGAPILSGGRGGLGVLFGPTGGYVLSWPIAAFIIGYFVEKNWNHLSLWKMVMFNLIGGVIVVYASGITYLSIVSDLTWIQSAISALTYIPGDVIKAVLSGTIALQIHKTHPLIEKKNTSFKQMLS
jgi:biotin transport system substrate-specific component